jgi:DNA polymerase-3 subunit gamma/tau
MGKALYREYRPKSLAEVVGQDHITKTLSNAIKKGMISHAYLFTGPRGVGKTSVARILAHEINGIAYEDESSELDIIEIDAASNRRIDEIRDLRDKVHIAPTSCKYKVYIIDEVHMLTREAFNALLKTLEEPPEHAVFILATTESHKVPDTIISRTQRFSFKPIYNESAVSHLRSIADKEKIDVTDDALELIAEHGNGSFRDSISMLDQITGLGSSKINAQDISALLGFPDKADLSSALESVAHSDVDQLFKAMQSLREKGANSSKVSQVLIATLRNQLQDKTGSLGASRTISLMKALLPLTGAQSSFQALEVALLETIEFSQESGVSKVAMTPKRVALKPVVTKIEKEIMEQIPEDNKDKQTKQTEETKDSQDKV